MSNYIGNQPAFGQFKRLDSLEASFDGSTTQFNLTYNSTSESVGDPAQLIVSLNGIIQEPLESYTLGTGGTSIVFSSAPASGDQCHIVLLGNTGGIASSITDAAITTAKIVDNAVDSTKLDETDSYTVAGLTTTGDINFGDNDKAIFGGVTSELQIYSDGSHSWIKDAGTGYLRILASDLRLSNSGNTLDYVSATDGGSVRVNYNGLPKLETTSTGIDVTGTVTADGLTVDSTGIVYSSGNVGIGTDGPTAILDVVGPAARPTSLAEVDTASTARFRADSSNNDSLYIAEADSGMLIQVNDGATNSTTARDLQLQPFGGKVGIGEIDPDELLHVKASVASGDAVIKVEAAGGNDATLDLHAAAAGGAQSKIYFSDDSQTRIGYIEYAHNSGGSSDFMTFGTSNTERIRIDSSGNVGIGDSTPSHKLDVAGDINAQSAFRTDEALPTIRPSLLLDFANSKTLDPRITFTRSSTATYYDGKTTAKAEENLLTLSEDFAAGWSGANVSVTNNNTTAPDGTTTAAKLLEQTDGGMRLQREPFTPLYSYDGDIAYSMYFKAGSGSHQYSWLSLRGESGDVFWAVFNLSTGSVTNSGSSGTASITSASMIDAGNGWYRCYIIGTYGQAYTNPIIYCGLSDGSNPSSGGYYSSGAWTQDGSYIYAWGGQVERRDFITAYTPTTYWTVTNNIPVLKTAASGAPRFDHDPVTRESKGLLIESQQTNLFSESVAQSTSWGGNFTTSAGEFVIPNYTIAPDGTKTAAKLGYNYLAGQQPRLQLTNISLGSNTYTMSFYAKSGEWDYISASFYYSGYVYVTVDLSDGSVHQTNMSSNSYGVEPVGNGWYRIWLSYTSPGTLNNNPTGLWPSKTGLAAGFSTAGEDIGGVVNNGVYVWGAQMETGVGASSYIPTNGSQVTRSGDTAHITGENFSNNINSEEFSLFVEGTEQNYIPTISNWMIEIADDSPYYERLQIGYYGGNFAATSKVYNTTQASFSGPQGATFGEYVRLAIGLKLNDAAASYDGGVVSTDTNCNHPIGLTRLGIGCGFRYGDQQLDGTIKKLAIWPKRLTNAQLQALTED